MTRLIFPTAGPLMRTASLIAAVLVSLSTAPLAYAASLQCTTAEKSAWLSPAKVKQMLEQHGFTNVGAPKASDGNCYVVQATDNTGAEKTLYLDPTDGALMAME
jgi:hypothetical protein